ncbi:MAG TPA: Sir2 family NAD-dependent protein deacetylase [Acidimicrobiales bacterium]|nr:Sir2 family NAD-dependent protein deacetylase [Acidimicrobiales bacterium]
MRSTEQIDVVRGWIDAATRVVVLTGAGISTDSGIPDFRGPQGVWTKNPEAERRATLDYYLADPEVRRRSWQDRLSSAAWQAEPNAGHLALVDLERRGKLDTLVTQNVDGLHQRAGTDPRRVVEIHGTIHWSMCMSCGDRRPMAEVLERVKAGDLDPSCLAGDGDTACGGILKSATISFGQSLVPEDLDRAERAASSCDLLLAVGSSLTVFPAAALAPLARQAGARLVIVNAQPTPYDDVADAVLNEPISEVLPALVR